MKENDEMYIIFLRFSEKKPAAAEFMAGHNEWVSKGIEDGVFLIVGSLKPRQGGTIIAHAETPEALELRVAADPFVRENVVSAEILELSVNKVAEGLEFLLADRMG